MPEPMDLKTYLASLPEVETARLPPGTLFTANGLIYQVVEIGAGGFHKARQWRGNDNTTVALVPGSFLATILPVLDRGRLLPVFPNRAALTDHGETVYYLFPDERQALDAAYLDAALVQSGDAYVRNHGRDPAFALTDGARVFRVYYYSRSFHGHAVDPLGSARAKTITLRLCSRGPMYWRLLPSWREPYPWLDDTLPNLRLSPPEEER